MDAAPAWTLEQATFGEQLDPLHTVNPDHAWYTDLDALLPPDLYGVTAKLEGLFRAHQADTRSLHVGLVGHGGTGKSTLVRQAMAGLRDRGILPVYVNARESFDHLDMAFADVLLVLTEAVVQALAYDTNTLTSIVDPTQLELARAWFLDLLGEDSDRAELFGELDSGANLDLPLVAGLAARIKSTLRSNNPHRAAIRMRASRDPDALVHGANVVLDAMQEALGGGRRRLCVIFDSLEKIDDRQQIDLAVLRRADELRRLRCHVIYCLSPADQYTPITTQIDQIFRLVEVPVIPVRTRRDAPGDAVDGVALEAIKQLLGKRLVLEELFATPDDCVKAIAHWSGGRLRDLIDITRQACEFGYFDAHADKVDLEHIERAARKIAARRVTVMTASCWTRAVEIHADKQISNREEDALMVQRSLVLGYDGLPWWDVHPFVLQDGRFWRATGGIGGSD